MYSQDEVRNKPKWRRSLLAASLLISPVAGVLMTSGAASAGENPEPEVTISFECGKNGPYVNVSIDGGTGSEKFYVEVDGGDLDLRYPNEGGKSAGHLKNRALFEGELGSGQEYDVDVYLEGGTKVGGDNFTFDCDGVDVSCANRSNPSITVVLPEKPGEGDPFTYHVELRNELDVVVDELDELASSGDSVVLNSGGQGTFTVVIIRQEGNQETSYEVTVSCPRKRPSTVTTAPPLPSTGSDSSTSLLILAPAMMALGGGLVLARRRMVKA